jgi:hypothetical protein
MVFVVEVAMLCRRHLRHKWRYASGPHASGTRSLPLGSVGHGFVIPVVGSHVLAVLRSSHLYLVLAALEPGLRLLSRLLRLYPIVPPAF